MTYKRITTTVILVPLLLSIAILDVNAETTQCTPITSLPTTITTQGVYCLTDNLSTNITSGYAIKIQANNVTIDFNGYKLGGLGGGETTGASGIYAVDQKNITIRNGIIRGFSAGVFLIGAQTRTSESSGHLIEDLTIDKCNSSAIRVFGSGHIIRGNKIAETVGTNVKVIGAYGYNIRVLDNDIITATGIENAAGSNTDAQAISLNPCHNCIIENNHINDVSAASGSVGLGFHVLGSLNALIIDNTIANADIGIKAESISGKVMNNLTSGVSTPFDLHANFETVGVND